MRFPWSGGRHPCLDALIVTPSKLIGVESKRYEPFRAKKEAELSDAYWRDVWGERMRGYESVPDAMHNRTLSFAHLDAAQLVKHAFGLRTAVNRAPLHRGKRAVLLYLYCEPQAWPDGRPILPSQLAAHREEIERFSALVAGDEVQFASCTYPAWLSSWRASPADAHAGAPADRFGV